jgi:hypothetical protein
LFGIEYSVSVIDYYNNNNNNNNENFNIQGKGRSQKNNNKTITTTKKTIKQTTEHIVRVK